MIQVVCFCGCRYSFTGDIGTCPECGEGARFPRAPVAAQHQTIDELPLVLKPTTDPTPQKP